MYNKNMKKATLFEIFKIFFIIGLQLLGGGYVIVPLLKKYVVDEKQWLSDEELVDFYAMSQCIPGIIAGNIATCSGYKARGFWGAFMALAGIVVPSFLIIILLANILTSVINYELIQNAFWGIRISVVVLVLMTIKDLWKKSVNSVFSYIMFFAILICLLILPVSPTIIIISSAIIALLYGKFVGGKND